jgi:tetratricopeptide (TPR) repeat protein
LARGRKAHDRKKQKKLDRRRRLDRSQRRNSPPLARQATPKLADKVDEVYDLISDRRFADAEQLLDRLGKRYDRYPAVVEAQVFLYQTTGNHERCCEAAGRLLQLTPRDPDARLMYAQESMLCGRVAIALANYRLFLQRWPDHANAQKAKNAVELIEPEYDDRIQGMGFGDAGLALLVLHEESLECVQRGQFEDAAEKCLELLKRAPDCTPARNNLALAYFQSGNVEKAVQVAEETCRLAPDNRFAEAALGKLRFLSGREDEANAIADRIVVNPPTEQDPLAAAIELLGFLGRDEDVMVLSEGAQNRGIMDPRCRGLVLHHLAVAQCRLGDEQSARSSWKKCLKALPSHPEARENLDDLDSGKGHAPWFETTAKWIPRAIFDDMFDRRSGAGETEYLDLTNDYPAIASLIPAILDRGDPVGREMAMRMAAADGSPAMLDALQQFALSSRGPDAMRHEVLNILGRRGRVDSGPHRFYSRGKWTEVKLFLAEISWEATRSATPYVQELVKTGMDALHEGDFALAEESFNRILAVEPDNCTAAYNLCVVWLERDGEAGRRRAQARLEELHNQFPDYRFALISLAQFAAMDGDLDRASDLLAPILEAKTLHATEAIALFTAQVQIAVKRRDFESAEKHWAILAQIAGEDDPKVASLRRLVDTASCGRGLRRLLSSF